MQFEPVRFSAALSLFGTALITLLALVFSWTALVVLAVGGVWAAAIGVFNSLFTHSQVTANSNLQGIVHDQIVSLSPFAPVTENVVVPVATSPLITPPVAVRPE